MKTTTLKHRFWVTLAMLGCAMTSAAAADSSKSVFATGLHGPMKLALTDRGHLLVTERGSGANDGRLSRVDRSGKVRPLLEGLPSGLEVLGQPSGPTAVRIEGCCVVELAIGEGNTLQFDPQTGAPRQIANPAKPLSPLFSSVLRVVFNHPVEELDAGFTLDESDHETLADGFTLRLANGAGGRLWMTLVADLKDFRPDAETNVRGSNPFGMAADTDSPALLLVDGGGNSVMQVGLFGPPKTLLRFPPSGGADAVPTSVHHFDGSKYLVTLFAGVPFAKGTASVRIVDVHKRTESPLITGLTSAIDVLALRSGFYVLEHSANVFAGGPTGRLLRFASPRGVPQELVPGLDQPTSLVYSPRHRAFFITELGSGQIIKVGL